MHEATIAWRSTRTRLVGGHADILEDEGAVDEEDIVGVRVKWRVQRRVECCVGGDGESTC